MGCSSSDAVTSPSTRFCQLFEVQSIPIEVTQVLLVANEQLSVVKELFDLIESSRLIMFRITKVSLIRSPTIIDAYLFWTNYIALCNEGQSKQNNVLYSFKGEDFIYSLGNCADLKLQWFGQLFSTYIKAVMALKLKLPSILEQLKTLTDRLQRIVDPRELKQIDMQKNKQRIRQNTEFLKVVLELVQTYSDEMDILMKKHQEIEDQSDEIGMQLFKKYGVKKIQQITQNNNVVSQERNIMKAKPKQIIRECFQGKFRSELEEQNQQYEKETRAKCKPKSDAGDDIGVGLKKFPYRIRWTGCKMMDQSLGVLSYYLEEHSKQLLQMRRYEIYIRYLTNAFYTKENTSQNAWKIFCQSLTQKQRVTIDNAKDLIAGLKLLKFSDPLNLKCCQYFIKLSELCDQQKLSTLDEMWANYTLNQQRIHILWSDNLVLQSEEFKQLKSVDKYYTLTSLAKNLYALQLYYPVSIKVYNQIYQKKLKRNLQFVSEMQPIYKESKPLSLPLKEIYKQQEQNDNQSIIDKKKIKYKYSYDKFN